MGVFAGVFAVVIPDNMSSIVAEADATDPMFTDAFVEYSQSRGFAIDAARVRTPTDKPRVERSVPYVRNNFFAGEDFVDLADAQRRAERWCASTARLRVHGTTQLRPAEVFAAEEAPLLLAAPEAAYDLPSYPTPKVHRDRHIEVDKALYSVPGELIGVRVKVRADTKLVKVFHRGQLIKVHPRVGPGRRRTDREDIPAERPSTRCATSNTCATWPPATASRWGCMRASCWVGRCRGPRCARFMPCWAWCAGMGPNGWRPPAPSGPRGRDGQRRSHRAHAGTGDRERRDARQHRLPARS